MSVRGRFAPTPSGRLHLGNARTALLAWLQVRRQRGVFVMRVEDVDPTRARAHLEADQLADLRWLGLDWDEGPDVGGPYGPYRQSERFDRYAAAVALLDTFPCTCTRRELKAAATPTGAYAMTCAGGPSAPSRPAARRWVPAPAQVGFRDACAGVVEEDLHARLGAMVLRRTDGVWSYQLAVALDDLDMNMTHVLRGADLLDSTARQLAVMGAVGRARGDVASHEPPQYAHVPIIMGDDGTKLSKRHGAPDLTALREAGADPGRVVAYLARSAGLVGPDVAHVTPGALVERFTLEAVRDAPTHLGAMPDFFA